MARPALVAVDADPESRQLLEAELRERYECHYRVELFSSGLDACELLEQLSADGTDLALLLVGQQLADLSVRELLAATRRLHPHARRVLLFAWGQQGDDATGELISGAIDRGEIDHYVERPSSPADELFHHEISGLLLEWADGERTSPHTTYVVGESWSGRAYELRESLGRCAMPHSFTLADSELGQKLLSRLGQPGKLPLVVFPDGTYLEDPTNAEMASASGSPVSPGGIEFDLVIVGAGPAGLSAAVYGASEGFSTLVVDEGGLGGQATSSSLIRNYLGFPSGISGRRLAQNAYQQAWVFGAKFAFMQRVERLAAEGGSLVVELADFGSIRSRAVLLATGSSYRQIGIPELEALTGAGVYYGGSVAEAPLMSDRDVFVVGGANSAGQAALHLARYARQVTLVVRAAALNAGMSSYLVHQIEATPNIQVRVGSEVVGGGGDGVLQQLVVRDRGDGRDEILRADALFVMIGAQPHTDWLPALVCRDEQGFVLTGSDCLGAGWPLERPPLLFESTMPGVFAVGDVRHGSVKRVASAVGEGSVAIQLLHRYFADAGR